MSNYDDETINAWVEYFKLLAEIERSQSQDAAEH